MSEDEFKAKYEWAAGKLREAAVIGKGMEDALRKIARIDLAQRDVIEAALEMQDLAEDALSDA